MDGFPTAPDHAALYVSDTEGDVVVRYPVADDGTTGAGTELAPVPAPDGMAVDVDGNLYVASSAGVGMVKRASFMWCA